MDLTPKTIEALETTFSVRFQEGYDVTPPWWDKIASLEMSKGKTNTYGWHARVPQMREWVGDRVVQNVIAYVQQIANRKFELTLGVDVETIEDDTFGIYNGDFMMMGEQDADHPNILVFGAIQAARTTTCFDGTNFFSTAHPVSMKKKSLGTYPNLYTGKALTPTNYAAVLADFRSRKGEDGRPLKLGRKLLLVVGPALEYTARTIVQADVIPSNVGTATPGTAPQTNVLKGSSEVLVLPEFNDLGTGLDWMLVEVGRPIKPFLYQKRVGTQFTALVSPTDPNVWKKDQLEFGLRCRDAAGVSLPFLASYCTPGA